jgi:hypothetical protein
LREPSLSVDAPGVLRNDFSPDGLALQAQLSSSPQHGTVTLNRDGGFLYTPTPRYSGPDSFKYIMTDGTSQREATVTIHVLAVDTTPPVTDVRFGFASNAYQVTLDPTDDISGMAGTLYRLDGIGFNPYTGPFSLTAGRHTLQFSSNDQAGNSESLQIFRLNVITPPNTTGQSLGALIARLPNGDLQVTAVIVNKTGKAMNNVALNRATLRTTTGTVNTETPLPVALGSIPANSSVTTTLQFPASVGARDAAGILSVGWASSQGAAGSSYRLNLP